MHSSYTIVPLCVSSLSDFNFPFKPLEEIIIFYLFPSSFNYFSNVKVTDMKHDVLSDILIASP